MRNEAENMVLEARIDSLGRQVSEIENRVPHAVRLVALREKKKSLDQKMEKMPEGTGKKSLLAEMTKCQEEIDQLLDRRDQEGWSDNPPELAEIQTLRGEMAALEKKTHSAPAAVAVREGGVPGSRYARIGDVPIHLRGEYQLEGDIVPRRFPVILAGESQVPLAARTRQSGRLELAEWIASEQNPLTARVMMNRIWHQLMGQGLVRTLDNFGRRGETPTHPELLDHLSHRFVKSGWSMKQMIRVILLSSTYRQASLASAEVVRADPENRLCARMNRRRLTYEEFRDSLNFVAGTLSVAAQSSTSNGALERRTIFEPLDRKKMNIAARMFDGPDPNSLVPQRAETTTAPQALYFMNNLAVSEAARRLAQRVLGDPAWSTEEQRLDRLWLHALGRLPAREERRMAHAFLAEHPWERFTHVLLSTNEFVYLD
ncbi:MAG: DUF1553 domain-containing protein [Planctomycetota bacterium]